MDNFFDTPEAISNEAERLLNSVKELLKVKTAQYFKIHFSYQPDKKANVRGEYENDYIVRRVEQALIARLVQWMLEENQELFKYFLNCTGGGDGRYSGEPRINYLYITIEPTLNILSPHTLKPSGNVSYSDFMKDAASACAKICKFLQAQQYGEPMFFNYGIGLEIENKFQKPQYLTDEFFIPGSLQYGFQRYDSFQDMRIHEMIVINMIKTDPNFDYLRKKMNNQNGGGSIAGVRTENLNQPGVSFIICANKRITLDGKDIPLERMSKEKI